jgi:hypothetical protein
MLLPSYCPPKQRNPRREIQRTIHPVAALPASGLRLLCRVQRLGPRKRLVLPGGFGGGGGGSIGGAAADALVAGGAAAARVAVSAAAVAIRLYAGCIRAWGFADLAAALVAGAGWRVAVGSGGIGGHDVGPMEARCTNSVSQNRNESSVGKKTSYSSTNFQLIIRRVREEFQRLKSSHFGNKNSQKYNNRFHNPLIISAS